MKLRSVDWLFITILLLFAAGLRIIGISYGQPNPAYASSTYPKQMLHPQTPMQPDEFLFISHPLRMVLTGQLNPKFFENPSFLINLNYVTFWLTNAGEGLSHEERATESGRSYAPFHLYIIGRTYSLLGGLLAVAATYAISRRYGGGYYAAIVAATLVAVSFTLVQHAHYSTTTSLATGFVALTIWTSVVSLHNQGYRRWLFFMLSGVAAGLATGSRYNAALISLIVLFTGFIHLYRQHTRRALAYVFVGWILFPLTFVLTTPFILLDSSKFIGDIRYISNQYLVGQNGLFTVSAETGLMMEYHYLVVFSLGIPAALMALIGMFAAWQTRPAFRTVLRRNSIWLVVLLLFVYLVPYSFLILRTVRPNGADQLLAPIIPVFAILTGVGAEWVRRRFLQRYQWRQRAMLLIIIITPLVLSMQFVRQLTQSDTRELMLQTVYDLLPRNSRVHLSGPYNLSLDEADYIVSQDFGHDFTSIADLQTQKVDYVVVSDASYRAAQRFPEGYTVDYLEQLVDAQLSYADNLKEIVRIDHPLSAGDDWSLHTASYWHNPGLRVYCLNEASCAALYQ